MPLNKKLERKFRKTYGIDLLPVGMADMYLADIVEWDGIIRKHADFENISLVDFLKIDDTLKENIKVRLAEVPYTDTSFQQIILDESFDIQAGVDIPNFAAKIGVKLGYKNFINFKIENVKGKILGRKLKLELIKLFNQAKEEDKKYYRKKLKKLFFIEKLFYAGNISFEIKASAKGKLDVALTEAKIIDPKISFSTGGNAIVTFPGSTVIPFAADIEPFKDLMD